MTVLDCMRSFEREYGKGIPVNGTRWQYYRLGQGTPILWLSGGLRRAALGFAFLERLAARHTVIAPDYPPLQEIDEFFQAMDTLLQAEGIATFTLGGQSYGGMLAQAYLAHRPEAVTSLILSSSGPADFSRAWLAGGFIAMALARLLPEKMVKNFLVAGLGKLISVPEGERAGWMEAFESIVQNDLTRADVISHFAVAASLIRKGAVSREALQPWPGSVTILSSENDPTQTDQDLPRYRRLFGRPVRVVNMGNMGHTAALFNPEAFVEILEEALV